MASACGKTSILLQPAPDDDVLREREAYKYYQPLQDLVQANTPASPPTGPCSSPDRALTAFAQLASFRLGVRRAFISLIDRKHQYILAEATKTLSLEKNTADDEKDNLWVGATAFERRATPCEYAAGLLVAPDLLVSEDKGDVVVFPDLSQHVLFKEHALVTEVPHGRFYAGVPIISPNGYNIGVFCILDDQPRQEGLTATEVEFMKDLSSTIMAHLEMVRATAELGRSKSMVQGLGQLVHGKSNLKDWWNSLHQEKADRPRSRVRTARSAFRSSKPSSSHLQTKFTSTDSPEVSPAPSPPVREFVGAHVPEKRHSDVSAQEARQSSEETDVGNQLQEDSIAPDIKNTFKRAADIIRTSVDVDGAIFLDASIGSFAGLVDGNQQHQGSATQSSTGTSSCSIRTTDSLLEATDEKRCNVLGSSLVAFSRPRSSHVASLAPPLPVSERFLQRLLAKYPKGKIWSYDEEDSSSHEGSVDSPRTADFVNRRGERWRERRMIQQIFPGARSLALVGMWDPHRSRWFAGSILWTCSPTRVLSTDSELNYMIAFGQSVMSEVARIDVKMADRAKATFISSISHELRTPLHGIMGSTECLQGTPLDAFQSSLINTVETCGKTLLDTFDNLLSYSKINNLTNSSNYRRPSVTSTRSELHRNGTDSIQSPVDLSILAEEVIHTAFAGNEFVRVIPPKSGISTRGTPSAHPVKGLEAITVLLDYDTSKDWTFTTQAGGWIRIILNLVGNSLKYTERGYVAVRLESRPLPSPTSEDDIEVILTVSDTGKGMSEDFLSENIFSPFVQEDPLSPGTGLGLSIVKQIITNMGGTISVTSKQEQGTQISVTVSMIRAESVAEPDTPSAISTIASLLRGKHLNMIIPDGEHDETGFSDLCSNWYGASVRCTSEPEEADLYIVMKRHTNALVNQLAFKPASASPIGARPVIILCRDLLSAHSLQTSKSMAVISPRLEYMSQPLAPNKVAKALMMCLEHPTCLTPDSTMTPTQPPSRTTSISAQRPRARRAGSNISQNSTASNPEVVLFTPMEEKTQEMLMFKVRQSVEANRQAEIIDAQKQALMPGVNASAPIAGVSVLLVDDNSINLNLLATFMKKQRHAYDTATNGLEAVQAYKAHFDPTRLPQDSENSLLLQNQHKLTAQSFDFVLMDVNMPQMDGLESTRHIRAFERSKGLRPAVIVALTGMASASVQQEAFASGVDLFLTKPVRLKELTRIFEEHAR
ncbi:hypothetical protein E4T43_08782 [Aureobasidium subglaciale]|nr:hypothetical protein E4T43_08782 [Aureobasidium subglaciale]